MGAGFYALHAVVRPCIICVLVMRTPPFARATAQKCKCSCELAGGGGASRDVVHYMYYRHTMGLYSNCSTVTLCILHFTGRFPHTVRWTLSGPSAGRVFIIKKVSIKICDIHGWIITLIYSTFHPELLFIRGEKLHALEEDVVQHKIRHHRSVLTTHFVWYKTQSQEVGLQSERENSIIQSNLQGMAWLGKHAQTPSQHTGRNHNLQVMQM